MERTQITPAPPGPDPAIEAATAEHAAQNPQPTAAPTGEEATRFILDTDTAPPRLPEKFKTVNDLVAAYEALEHKMSANAASPNAVAGDLAVPPPLPGQEVADPAAGTPEEQWAAKVSAALESMTDKWARTGEISQEDSKVLEGFGISSAYQKDYLAGDQARRIQRAEKIYEVAGGKEQYQELAKWANDNLTEGQKAFFNESIQSENEDAVQMAIDAVRTRAAQSGGQQMQGSFVGGGINKPAFRSQQEWLAAVAAPEYQNDPAVQAEVMSRLHRAKQAGAF